MKKAFLSAILIITAAVLSLIICSCGKTPENSTTAAPTTAQQYIGTVPSGVDLFDDETDNAANEQTVAPNEPYDSSESNDSGNNNGDKTVVSSGDSAKTTAKSTKKASVATSSAKATSAKATVAKATSANVTAATSAKTEKTNIYDPAMPDKF